MNGLLITLYGYSIFLDKHGFLEFEISTLKARKNRYAIEWNTPLPLFLSRKRPVWTRFFTTIRLSLVRFYHYTELNKGGRVFPILLLAFIFVPIIEIGLFIQVGGFFTSHFPPAAGLSTRKHVGNPLAQGMLNGSACSTKSKRP